MKAKAVRTRRRPRLAAFALSGAFLFLAISPALPVTAAPLSAATAFSQPLTGGNDETPETLPSGPTKSAPISDDVADLPARVIGGHAAQDHFGTSVIAIGDLNGDHAGDLAVVSRSPWAVNIELGSTGGFSAGTEISFKGSAPSELFGVSVAGGGDFNGDGYGDFAVTVGRFNSFGQLTYEVQVFYGASVISQNLLKRTLTAPSSSPTFGAGLAVLSDVDGDYYSDLLVTAPPGGSTPTLGSAWIFRGDRAGLDATADWSYANTVSGILFGAGAFALEDLNGDYRSDFAITTGGQPGPDGLSRMFVFYGATDLNITPPTEVRGEQGSDGFGSAVGTGDFDGDGLNDLVVGSPGYDRSSEQRDAGRVSFFRGTPFGIVESPSSSPPYGASGSRFGSAVAGVGDISGDGVEDVAVGAPLASANGPMTNGQVFLYFGGDSGLSHSYDMTEAGDSGNDLFAASIASRIDMDADGRSDLALGASGRDASGLTDAGAVYLYSGLRLRLPALAPTAFSAPDLVGGKALARYYSPYQLGFSFVYRGDPSALRTVEETLWSSALNKAVTLYFDFGRQVVDVGGARELVELYSDSKFEAGSTFIHSYKFQGSVKFAWGFADPNPISVDLRVQEQGSDAPSTVTAHVGSALTVVSSLAFSTKVHMYRGGDVSKEIDAGGYARAGESILWSGGGLVYAGTDIVPPASEVSLFVVNEAGASTRAGFDPTTGDLYVEKPLQAADDPADIHHVRALAPSGAVLTDITALVRIDGLPVAFGATTPRNDETVTLATYPVTMEITDAGAGVDGNSVEWSVSHQNPPSFTTWQRAQAPSGPRVTARADVPLVEAAVGFNFVRFRAGDVVGNALAVSPPLEIRLDYGAVSFAMLSPSPETWQLSSVNTLSFEVRKETAPFLDLASLEYEVDTPTSTGWRSVGLRGESDVARFTVTATLPDGDQNQVRLRIRLTGHADDYLSPPFTVRVDTMAPSIELVGPSPEVWATGGLATSTARISDASSGVSQNTILYRFIVHGSDTWSAWSQPELTATAGGWLASGRVPVNDGVENFVVWQAADAAGNEPATSQFQRLLADSRPVSFLRPIPGDGAVAESVKRLVIDVSDGEGSGVDLSSLEYRVDMPGGLTTGWTNAGRTGIATRATISVSFELPLGTSSVSWRAQDAAGTPTAASTPSLVSVQLPTSPARAPHLILTSPVSAAHYRAGVDIRFDASDSFDPDGGALYFTWSIDGQPQKDRGSSFWMQLPPGTHTVTLVVSDGSESPDITIAFVVDPPVAPPGVFSSPLAQAAVASLAALLVGALAVAVWAGRAKRALES